MRSERITAQQARTFERYSLCVPAAFTWTDERGLLQKGCGSTRDISAQGVFVQAWLSPLTGSLLNLEVALPSGLAEFPAVTIKVRGRVVRVERPDNGKELQGFAVRHDSFVLQTEAPALCEENSADTEALEHVV
jgi:hypothetical protein